MRLRNLLNRPVRVIAKVKHADALRIQNVAPLLIKKIIFPQTSLRNGTSATPRHFSTKTITEKLTMQPPPVVAQGVRGRVELVTGNFSFLTKYEINAIQAGLSKGKVLTIVYDRDSIMVPANERAMWIREHFKNNANLEVRVAYGPPPEKDHNESEFISYIKKQLPNNVQVGSVRCSNLYSALLAKDLNVPFLPSPDLKDIKPLEEAIKRDPNAHKHLLLPAVAKRVISPFREIIDPDSFKQLCESEKTIVQEDILRLNHDHPNSDSFFSRTRWNTASLGRINLPVAIGKVDTKYRKAFSNHTNAQIFDMPVYMPEQGWKIPMELSPYQHVFAKMVAAESLGNSSIADCNAYVTIDSGVVFPNGYARRGGLHVDGFLTKANARGGKDGIVWGDNTYIVSDSAELQTEFYPGPFDLSHVNCDDPQSVLKAFEAQGRHMSYMQSAPYDIVRLTTNNVHAVHPNLTHEYLQRCFLKMTFSERLFNRGGNTINPNLNYRFTYVPRASGRNTQNLIGIAPVGFNEVDLKEIDFANSIFPQWAEPKSLLACKNPDLRVTATPASEGEILETKVDGQVVTTNVARAGDMKVSRTGEDSYYLGSNFSLLYKPTGKSNVYTPSPRTLRALRVNKNVTFPANWGTRQNIPAGGYIVQDNSGDTWGVHEKSFAATYLEVDNKKNMSRR